VDGGSAGRSAAREYERRRAQREQRARARLGPLGQTVARLIGDPQSTRAWKQGANAEIRVARQLAKHLNGRHVVLLHDRRIPGRGRANIDHITIGPGGITVIDTKSARGRPRIEMRGGFLSPRRELLLINGRDRTQLVDALEHQIEAVRTAIAELTTGELDVRGAHSAFRTSRDYRDSGS
jgi:Nuclease-related domain